MKNNSNNFLKVTWRAFSNPIVRWYRFAVSHKSFLALQILAYLFVFIGYMAIAFYMMYYLQRSTDLNAILCTTAITIAFLVGYFLMNHLLIIHRIAKSNLLFVEGLLVITLTIFEFMYLISTQFYGHYTLGSYY